MTKLDTSLETKKLLVSKVVLLLIQNYNMVFKLVSKLVTKVLATNILDSKLVSKRLIEINLEYKVVSN